MNLLDTIVDPADPDSLSHEIPTTNHIRRGPPNRMNDLPYKEWMKFQKSFFRYGGDQKLVEDFILFFTKAIWPNGDRSRSLVIGVKEFVESSVNDELRIIESYNQPSSTNSIAQLLGEFASEQRTYDFALVDLRHALQRESLSTVLNETSDQFFTSLTSLIKKQKYCVLLVPTEGRGGGGFPIPWSVALAGRAYLRLRDEKIGLIEDQDRVFYCIIMQSEPEGRPSAMLTPETIHTSKSHPSIPAWLIPKPPARKKNEVLHPAKYPETLVSDFIELFTKPGDTVCDPMVGTGSTIVAAVQTGRHGVGIEISPEFTRVAQQRVSEVSAPSLFEEHQRQWSIVQGDASSLSEISDLVGKTFDYVITSPPYWSMLTNPGSENQENRRKKSLPLVYSDSKHDLGNVTDYDEFLNLLTSVYDQVADKLDSQGYLTVVVKNVKRNHILYPLAWDLVMRLCGENGRYDYTGATLWCQDDVALKPFAVGIHWVSNILHHYCLHFKKREVLATKAV